jgi:hypothetical protein
MDYKVTFKVTYKDGDSFTHEESFITKGSNRKVLRAAIKEIIEEMCSENYGLDFENFANIEVLKIIRTDTLNFNNVWNKDLYKKFLSKYIK